MTQLSSVPFMMPTYKACPRISATWSYSPTLTTTIITCTIYVHSTQQSPPSCIKGTFQHRTQVEWSEVIFILGVKFVKGFHRCQAITLGCLLHLFFTTTITTSTTRIRPSASLNSELHTYIKGFFVFWPIFKILPNILHSMIPFQLWPLVLEPEPVKRKTGHLQYFQSLERRDLSDQFMTFKHIQRLFDGVNPILPIFNNTLAKCNKA